MNDAIEAISEASEGLLYMSESDYPFEIVAFGEAQDGVESKLKSLSNHPEAEPEIETLDYFFRNQVKEYEGDNAERKQMIQGFRQLQKVLNEHLSDIKVYRIGSVQIDAFIIGRLKTGGYAGLRTKLIET